MQYLLDSIIYLLAIMGIIFTTMTFFEMFIQKRTINSSYRIFNKNNENNINNKKVEIIIHIENLDEKEEEVLIKQIEEEKKINLKEIATSILIQKDK